MNNREAPILAAVVLMIAFAFMWPSDARAERTEIDFNASWKFKELDDPAYKTVDYDDSDWTVLNVPHDYIYENGVSVDGSQKQFGGYHGGGIAWYRKHFSLDNIEAAKTTLEFDGVYMNSEVWINGHYLGGRPYGYISFRFDISDYLRDGDNVISVRVDNELQPSARWYHPGGIYAPVRLIRTDPTHIEFNSLFVRTPTVSEAGATLDVSFSLAGPDGGDDTFSATLELVDESGAVVASETQSVANGNVEFVGVEVDKPRLWSPDTPSLYDLEVSLIERGKPVDAITRKIGFREVRWDTETGFWLNGKNVKLQGVSEHWEGGPVGGAWTKPLLKWKLSLLKEMGVNAVRVGHNPYPPMFYDLCDELGLMVMDEIFDGWLQKAEHDYGAHHFDQWWKVDIKEWVTRDRNHPSIIIYSVGNETHGDVARDLVKEVKKYDPTRLVTSGSAGTEAMEVAGENGKSETRYYLENVRFDKPFVSTEAPHTWQTRGYYKTQTWWRDGPLPVTYPLPDLTEDEIFHYEWTNPKNWANRKQHFNSSYDNATVRISARKHWEKTRDLPYYSGHFRWTGFDYHGESGLAHGGWPFILFMGGTLDVAGFKKDLFYFYQSQYTEDPMLHILPSWTHPRMARGTEIPVWVYSNLDEVELLLNGRSLGRNKPGKIAEEMQAEWRVPWEPGQLTAISFQSGKEVLRKTLGTAEAPTQLEHRLDTITTGAAEDTVYVVSSQSADRNGEFYPYASNKVFYQVSDGLRIMSLENGSPVDHTNRTSSDYRAMFMGKTRAFIEPRRNGRPRVVTIGSIMGDESLHLSDRVSIDVQRFDMGASAASDGGFEIYYSVNEPISAQSRAVYAGPIRVQEGDTVYVAAVTDDTTLLEMEQRFGKGTGLFWGDKSSARMWAGKGVALHAEWATLEGARENNVGRFFKGTGYADFEGQEGSLYWEHENDGDNGPYKLGIRYAHANERSNLPMLLTVNGDEIAVVKFESTGSWTHNWKVNSIEANLINGTNRIELKSVGESAPNIDQIGID